MSANSIARWNAIPMSRNDGDDSYHQHQLKRTRPDNEDSDDDVSIVSRSPSPNPDAMDVDSATGYFQRSRVPPPQVVTVETRIKPENKGFSLLAKMGWTEGQPLGLSGDGRVDPIPFQLKNDSTGIGKITQDVRMIETTVSQRRELDSERQRNETEDQRKAREVLAARKAALETEISTTLRAFYCQLCDKQFKTVAQYDEHTNSYAHHHKARLKDMQANARPTSKDEVEKRKEKEKKREEKELRKIAKASGMKIPKAPATTLGSQQSMSGVIPASDHTGRLNPGSESSDTSGQWASVNSSTDSSAFKRSGWSTINSAQQTSSSSSQIIPTAPTNVVPSALSSSHSTSAPAFRNAGWTSLDTGVLPQPPAAPPPVPDPNTNLTTGGWQPLPSQPRPPPEPTASQSAGGGWKQFQSSMKGKNRR